MTNFVGDDGHTQIIWGKVTYSAGTPSVSTNDGSASIADNANGKTTLTFDAFLTAPAVIAGGTIDAALSATNGFQGVNVVSKSTTTAVFQTVITGDNLDAGVGPAVADAIDFDFIIMGKRNR